MVGFEYRFSSSFRCLPHQEKLQLLGFFSVLFPPQKTTVFRFPFTFRVFFPHVLLQYALCRSLLSELSVRERERESGKSLPPSPTFPFSASLPLPLPLLFFSICSSLSNIQQFNHFRRRVLGESPLFLSKQKFTHPYQRASTYRIAC